MIRKFLTGLALAGTAGIAVLAPTTAIASNPCVNAIAERDARWEILNEAIRRCDRNNPGDGCPGGNNHVARAEAEWYQAMLHARQVCQDGY